MSEENSELADCNSQRYGGAKPADRNPMRYAPCDRCGSDCVWWLCGECTGSGREGHRCGDDPCECLPAWDNVECEICNGFGGAWICVALNEYCRQRPLTGREETAKGHQLIRVSRQFLAKRTPEKGSP